MEVIAADCEMEDDARTRINDLADWLAERPASVDSYTLQVGRLLGAAVVSHLALCELTGVAP